MSKLYEGQKRLELLEIIENLSFMGLPNKEKHSYCLKALRHAGLNISMIRYNCDHCGIKNCKVKKLVFETGL